MFGALTRSSKQLKMEPKVCSETYGRFQSHLCHFCDLELSIVRLEFSGPDSKAVGKHGANGFAFVPHTCPPTRWALNRR